MDRAALADQLREGSAALGLELPPASVDLLLRHVELLLKWNKAINLTAVTDPAEVIEKHVLDSLLVAPLVPAGMLLDAGSGAGFPGIPIRLVRPDVEVVLADSVGKKVAFLKNVVADLRLQGVRSVAVRLAGEPTGEGIPLADAAVARAFAAPAQWLALARHYVKPGGVVLALAGPRDDLPQEAEGVRRERIVERRLPFSGAERRIGVYRRDG